MMYQRHRAFLNKKYTYQQTSLHIASDKNETDIPIYSLLLGCRADCNYRDVLENALFYLTVRRGNL